METQISELDELLVELIERVAGELGVIIYSLGIEGEFTDEQLSQELGVEINDVRRVLFALYEIGLATYRRTRDEETGWMEYYWKISYDRERDVLRKELEKTREKLEAKLEIEDGSVYYICVNGCVKVSYEEAMEFGFSCPKCGDMLEFLDSSGAIEQIREELEKINRLIGLLS
ncbi:transcription factor E [Geoglobus acetivorans]|uniref:Transcription factor E n=1 Tax=Geoglobus acetivorans TaxID=565033 RepID=A0A0A7GFT8_GEOAI|nr:Archaeal transcription factor E [Geoglobus acetivorans]